MPFKSIYPELELFFRQYIFVADEIGKKTQQRISPA